MPKSRIITGEGASLGAETAFKTLDPLAGGATFDSGILPLAVFGHTQVQTEVLSDTDGTLQFIFHATADGLNIVRQLNVPYLASEGYRLYAAPSFAPFAQYKFVNSATPQTSFYYTTKFLVSALSSQTLQLDAFLSPSMVANVMRAIITGVTPGGTYGNVALDAGYNLKTRIAEPLTGFGEVRTAEPTPIVQIDAVQGLTEIEETFVDSTPGTGSVSADAANFVCQTGTGIGGYGVIRSARAVRYHSGQGMLFRGTAIFDSANATANSLQAFGAFNSTNGLFVGYNGADFGVMHRTGGKHEIRVLTVTNDATGSETVSLTLNSVLYSIPVTNVSVEENAHEIEAWLNTNQTVWDAYQETDKVVLFNRNAGPASGTYSISSTGALTGTISQTTAGVANTETWVTQANFNGDTLDGTGPSGMTLDPAKGNVYQIVMQYLGYGNCKMEVENPETNELFTFHTFKFANSRTEPSFQIPAFKVGWISASLGSTTNLTVKGASCFGAIEGIVQSLGRPKSKTNQVTGVGGTLTPILSIRVRGVFNGITQLNEVVPKFGSATADGTKAVEVRVLLNPTFSDATNWTYVDENQSVVEFDTTATAFSSEGDEVFTTSVNGSTVDLPFAEFLTGGLSPLYLQRGDVLCIAARVTSGATQDVTASLTWVGS